MRTTALRRPAMLVLAATTCMALVAPTPAHAEGPWLDTADVLAVLASVSRLPETYQVERIESNGRFAMTVGRDGAAGLTRVTSFVDGGVVSDVVTADGRGVWTALDRTPEVQSELDYLSRTTARWTYTADAEAQPPAILQETGPASILSVLPGMPALDNIPVTSHTMLDGARSPVGTQYSIPFDLQEDPETGEVFRRWMFVRTDLDGTLRSIDLWEPDGTGTTWLYSQAVGVAPPDPGSVVDAADVAQAARAVGAARRAAAEVAVAANAAARARHRKTRTSDLVAAARRWVGRHRAGHGLHVTTHPSGSAVRVSVTDRAVGRTTSRTVWVDQHGRATTRTRP